MPEGSINHAGLGCVKNQPDRARNIVPVKRPGPGFSAILGQIDAAMRIWGVCPPESRNEYNVGVLRVYEYVPDMFRVGESHMTPGAPGVVRSPDPVASIHRSERSARGTKIARADVNDFRIRRCEGDCAYRSDIRLVKDRTPHDTRVRALPKPPDGEPM